MLRNLKVVSRALLQNRGLRFVSTTPRVLQLSVLQPNVRHEVLKFDPGVPVEKACTPPASWYTEPAVLQLEKKAIFSNNWTAVGRVDQVATPGQFFEGKFANEAYVICRDENNELQAFFNVCRHHAMPVAKGEGKIGCFECPYHGWTYALNGRLTKARKLRGIEDFKAKNYGLIPMPVTTWGQMVMVKLRPGRVGGNEDLTQLNPYKEYLTSTGYDPENFQFVRRKAYEINSNWKVIIDNFIDGGYHIDFAHKTFVDGYYDFSTYQMKEANEDYSTQLVRVKLDKPKAIERIGLWSTYSFAYPNFMISRYGPWYETNIVVPLGHDRAMFVYDFYLEKKEVAKYTPEELDALVTDSVTSADQVQQEDTEICEGVQTGMASVAYEHGRYAPRIEYPQHLFHVRLGKDMRVFLDAVTES